MKKNKSLLATLILLTILSIFTQLLFLWVNSLTNRTLDTVVSASLTSNILHSKIFIVGLLQLLAGQFLVYAAYISIIWYAAISISELFKLQWKLTYYIGITLWMMGVIAILTANILFIPHGFFSQLIQNALHLTSMQLRYIFIFSASICFFTVITALLNLSLHVYQKKFALRHKVALVIFTSILCLLSINLLSSKPSSVTVATQSQPNIIIIGIDAVRPDFIGFYNHTSHTPTIDSILKLGINFSNTYTPLARTFPSWTSILTGTYPLHNLARGNNTNLNDLDLTNTLPKYLKNAGYETIYATDDTRFNNTNQLFGFNQVITPPMGLNDFLIGTFNDFPLSNLLIPTAIGRLLFPYSFSNHGAAITYNPENFLQLLSEALHERPQKPLFLAVHFTISHWPFYWFNDKQELSVNEATRYQHGIEAADHQLADFLAILQKNKLLDHTIVVLLSDHGTSLGLRGDRAIAAKNYQGNPINIKKLKISKYSDAPPLSLEFARDYGVDTSYGYGGDILSLKQYHTVLAFKGYGIDIGKPHTVSDRINVIDIAPTLLDLLKLKPLTVSDGASLKPYLLNLVSTQPARPFYFETTFSIDEIEKQDISIEKVLLKTIQLYQINLKSGLIFVKHDAEMSMNQNKERAIMEGDWLLAQFPASQGTRLISNKQSQHIDNFAIPSYSVLLNLKTGQWTTEFDSAFAKAAPVKSLVSKLRVFYGNELREWPNPN